MCATLEVWLVQCTEIMAAQSERGATSIFVATCWLVRPGRGFANHFLDHSNGSMMAQQTTLFGTVVEKG